MFDLEPERQRLQRARGRAEVGFVRRSGDTRLKHLHQSGCAKAMLPRVTGNPEVVFLNTAGGLTGGDHLEYRLDLDAGGRVTATTQTAERAYESVGGSAKMRCAMSAGDGAALDWLPQETILFDRSSLDRRTEIDLAGDARLVFCEMLVLGRAAMGETVRDLHFMDRREIRRDGRPVLFDAVQMNGRSLEMAAGPAMLDGARAVAVLALVGQGAEDALAPIRTLLTEPEVTAAASGWDGKLIIRMMARDGWPMRRLLVRLLTHIRGTAPPRVWQI